MRLLLVEDDPMLGLSLVASLRGHGFAMDWAHDGEEADCILRAETFDAVLLDIGLPKRDGLSVLLEMRQRDDSTPVIIITARDEVTDRVHGLDLGADDYLGKPFSPEELMARLRALQRRRAGRTQPVIEHLGLTLNPASRTAHFEGKEVCLTRREFAVLMLLVEQPGHVWSKDQLVARVYGWEGNIASNVIEVHVHSLRKKLSPAFIVSVRGVGYTSPKNLTP